MSQSNHGSLERDSTADTSIDLPAPEDLSRFRLECLVAIAHGDDGETPGEDIHGLGIKSRLETHYGTHVHHGRLYPNLDWLVDHGLVEKRAIDNRTNGYRLTDAGAHLLQARAERFAGAVGEATADETLVTDGGSHPCEEEMLDVELVLGAGRLYDHQVRLDVTSSTVVDRAEGRLELSLADGEMDEYLAELGLKSRTDEFATEPTESQEGA